MGKALTYEVLSETSSAAGCCSQGTATVQLDKHKPRDERR